MGGMAALQLLLWWRLAGAEAICKDNAPHGRRACLGWGQVSLGGGAGKPDLGLAKPSPDPRLSGESQSGAEGVQHSQLQLGPTDNVFAEEQTPGLTLPFRREMIRQ